MLFKINTIPVTSGVKTPNRFPVIQCVDNVIGFFGGFSHVYAAVRVVYYSKLPTSIFAV